MKKLLVMMALALVPMLSFGQSVYSRSGSYEGKGGQQRKDIRPQRLIQGRGEKQRIYLRP